MEKAIADAVADVDSPLLTGVYLGEAPTIEMAKR
jgi:hypothetical protein